MTVKATSVDVSNSIPVLITPNNILIKLKQEFYSYLNIYFEQKNTGSIRLTKPVQEALNDVLNYEPLVYEVIFPIQYPIPKIKAIYYNDILICSGPGG